MNLSINLAPIGFMKSCYPAKFGVPRQSGLVAEALGQIEILPVFQPELSLMGLEAFSHCWLLWGFHLNENTRFRPKVHPPRLGGRTMGVFATRSPHRPNPIGLSLVEIQEVAPPSLWVRGVDIVDGTPIYDIKPYIPEYECPPLAKSGWAEKVDLGKKVEVSYTAASKEALTNWLTHHPNVAIFEIISQTISLDPRPIVYRGFEGQEQGPYRQVHVFSVLDLDIEFTFLTPNRAKVLQVRPRTSKTP